MEPEIKKACNSCLELKPLIEFSKQSSSKDGHKYRCKICDKRYFDNYYAQKKPQVMETVRDWQKNNKAKVSEHKKKYRDKVKGLPTEKLDDNTLINLYLEMCQFYPVTHGEGSATSPEDGKVKAMRKFISYVRQQAKLLQKDVEMIDDVSNSFVPQIGFSDDDERNLQAMINKLSDDEEKSLKMYTTKTGEKKEFQGTSNED